MAGREDGEFNTTVKDHFGSTITNGASANIKMRQDEENDICSLLLLPITPGSFRASEMLNFVCEKLSREHENLCQRPVKHGNVLTVHTRVPQAGFLIIQFLDMIGKVAYQDLSQTASMTLNLGREDFLVANCCKCNDSFSILENILRSGKFHFLIFRTCRGKTCLLTESTTQPVSSEEIRELDALFIEISSHKNVMNDLLDKTIRTNAVGDSGNAPSSVITDQDFLKELSEIEFQCRKSVEKLRKTVEILKEPLQCAMVTSPRIQNGFSEHFNPEQHLPGETSASRNDISTQSTEQTRNEDSPENHGFSLPTLLSSVSQFLGVADWEKLRYIITQHIPNGALENIENGVELLQLLVNRYLISSVNFQFLRDAFFAMGRFDLVHLIDCIKEGDYSLLNNESTAQKARNGTQTQAGYTSINHLDITPLQQMQNLNLRTNSNASHSQNVHGSEPLTMASNPTSKDDDMLQLKHKDVPQGSLVSRGYPIQENSADHSDANEDGDNDGSHTARTRAEIDASHDHSTIDSDSLHTGQAMSPDGNTSTTDQSGFSEHFNPEQHLPGETSASRNDISTQSTEQTRNEDSPENHGFSLPTLLSSVSQFLGVADWEKLRYIITQHIPNGALENIENGVELLQLLVNRYLISSVNFQFLRDAFFAMGRFDLVHLIDCIKEGDYSLLNNESTAQKARNGTQTQAGYTSINHLDITPLQQMQNLNLRTNSNASHSQNVHGSEPLTMASNPTSKDDDMLQLKHKDVPQGSLVSRGYPIQENSADHSDANEDGDNDGSHTARTRAEIDASHDHSTIDSDSLHTGQAMSPDGNTSTTDQSSEGRTTWVNNPGFSCNHYERLCDVQFSCCERFWPCHRCHNSESLCEVKKLRSRDIKIVKCKRCGKEQQFPKENPHCVECNLKFAEYFCAMCQHLTGKQNHPYHCEKCGICRVHGDRSFHCDVCGVCLDVNLRDNHKCRAGSAHDECCICFEDAFNGCQILPCSHKVHRDCATAMLRNGITKCPVCRESFEQRVEHRP